MQYLVTEVQCESCEGEGVIFTPSPVPYLESDQPCGTCMGLGVVERIAYSS